MKQPIFGFNRFFLWVLSVLMLPFSAMAWGAQGHQAVAALAQQRLSPQARVTLERLLAQEPGASLASISTWADEHRNPASARWHYVNFPADSCAYDAARDCPGGQCVVTALQTQIRVLASAAPDGVRWQALKYVVHLMADIHQPLHAGRAEDRGGNTYQIRWQDRGSNLHALWDSGLLRELDPAWMQSALPASGTLEPAAMAEESCRLVADAGFYPQRSVTAAYQVQWQPVLVRRLQQAAVRLSDVLNQALAS